MPSKSATFRFYEELNEFLNSKYRKKDVIYQFYGNPKVKDAIESYGIPHTEIDLILTNGHPVDFDYKIKNNDRIAVYPKFETFDIGSVSKLQNAPIRKISFILDVHLGKLAKYLRLTGFDTLYHNKLEDREIVDISKKEERIILTRDKGILKHNQVTHGYYIRSDNPKEQLKEVITRFDLSDRIRLFTRCMECNGILTFIPKEKIQKNLLHGTKKYYNEFFKCKNCGKIYWKGSHYRNMKDFINSILQEMK